MNQMAHVGVCGCVGPSAMSFSHQQERMLSALLAQLHLRRVENSSAMSSNMHACGCSDVLHNLPRFSA